ncbi:MAG: bifunctional 3-deoxy-7-phosphoheptulonate synthase/chorismate mutase type II [Acidobacteria bacterium]|nr:bifunctional 3-deoxy-7-phosphoheptulonate synthase/chorismate mutase type II [Acidobacteriota bacterium]
MSADQPLNINSGWLPAGRPFVISGPCAAETEAQTIETARRLRALDAIHVFRAGVWKPRTRPGHYEGSGEAGLAWLVRAKEETGLPITTEVANGAHVDACLRSGVDMLWVGARTTSSPFAVQEIADALRGVDVPVFVKNPPSPDLELWIGAIERLDRSGLSRLGAVHRGFSVFDKGPFRNAPMWDIAIELKTHLPGLPLLCDPSHICGNRELIQHVAQKALDLEMDGLMIESHANPDAAWSDAKQQLTPEALGQLLANLAVRERSSDDKEFEEHLEELRRMIDSIDDDIMHKLAARMAIVEKIGAFKRRHNVTILQVERWEAIIRSRSESASSMGLGEQFVSDLLRLIHREAIQLQERVMNETKVDV